MSPNADKQDQGRTGRFGGLFRRRRRELTIDGFHQGDIRSDKPVVVESSGAVRGSIYAPSVVVAGTVSGVMVARTATIEPTGQVWGDINAGAMELQPGGKLFGWFNAIDDTRYERLVDGEVTPDELAADGQKEVPDFMTAHDWPAPLADVATVEDQRALMRQLRAEAAAAIMERAELEARFDEKVKDAAGEKISRADGLREELMVAKGELITVRTQLDETAAALQEREQTLGVRADELQELREQLAAHVVARQEMEATAVRQRDKVEALREERDARQKELEEEQAHVQKLTSRIENLEMALQDSLRRTSEQEEALIHWQELAENSENRAQELDEELVQARARLDTTGPLVEQLHRECEEKDEELTRAREALQAAQARNMKLDAEVATARQQLEALHRELGNAPQDESDPDSPPLEPVQALRELKSALDNASSRVLSLEEERETLAGRLQAYHERLLWAEAAQKEARTASTEATEKLKFLSKRYRQMEEALKKERQQGARWKANVDRTLEMMYAAEKRVEEIEAQLAASEAEVAAKAERLQALQTILAERDEAHKQAMKQVTEQEEKLAQLHDSYEQQLQEKSAELAKVRESVDRWLTRRNRSEEA